jgi:integrase/recombinase XerD
MIDIRAALDESSTELRAVLAREQGRLAPAPFAELVEFIGHVRIADGLAPRTCSTYASVLAVFLGWLAREDCAPQDVDLARAERFARWLALDRVLSPRSRRLRLSAVRRYFAWREPRFGGTNPFLGVSSPRVARTLPKKFSTTELRAIFGAIDRTTANGRRDFALLLTLYATGARRDEMRTLTMDRVELRERVGYVTFTGKGAKERVVSIEGAPVDALRAWLIERDGLELIDRDAVWVSPTGHHRGHALSSQGIEHALARIARAAGVRGTHLHRFRVTFATDLYDAGVGVEEIRLVLGHESLETTRRYLAISDRARKVRMPRQRLAAVTGGKSNVIPLWAQPRIKPGAIG